MWQAACGVAHTVLLVVSRCLPLCPGKAKLILKTSRAQGCLVCCCAVLQQRAVGAAGLGVLLALLGQQPLAYPQSRVGSSGIPAPQPLMPFPDFSEAIKACNAFGVGIPPVFPLGFSSFRQLHLPGVSVGVGADGCLFVAV